MDKVAKIKGKNENGEIKEYDVILTFTNARNNKDYIVYTDNTYDDEGKLKISAAIYNEDQADPFVGYPITEEEWKDISDLLDRVIVDKD